MFCSSCGTVGTSNALFCSRCGVDMHGSVMLVPAAAPGIFTTAIQPLPPSTPPLTFASSRGPAPKASSGAATAAWILLVFACAGALIPGLGFGMWLIIGPILLITLVLGVLAISKGGTANGVMIILMSLVVVPVFVALAPFIGTLVAVGAAESASESLSVAETPEFETDVSLERGVLGMPLDGGSPSEPAVDVEGDRTATAFSMEPAAREPAPVAAPEAPTSVQPAVSESAAVVSGSVSYAVMRTQPTLFSKGLGRLEPGTSVTLGATVPESDWIAVETADGRRGYLRRGELDFVN